MDFQHLLSKRHFVVLVLTFASFLCNVIGQFTYEPLDVSTFNVTLLEPFKLDIYHVSSSPSQIVISWNVPFGYSVKEYQVQHREDIQQSWMTSSKLSENQTQYSIDELRSDSLYDICVQMNYTDNNQTVFDARKCSAISTIPFIRMDSILALVATVGYIVITVLIGCCHWMRRKAEFDKMQRERGEQLRISRQEGQTLLKGDNKPHCSIEERTTSL